MRRAQILCAVAWLASACGSSAGTAAEGSPSALPSTPTSASSSSATASPGASAPVTSSPSGVSAADLNCRLPITAAASAGEPVGGWITFPGGAFARDPATLPIRLSNHGPSYDRAIGAWVPVEYENVAPDGASYALYNEPSTEVPNALYLVDAKTGKRRLISSVSEGEWQAVLDYAAEGVYLAAPGAGMALPVPGLWLLDPKTGGTRLIDRSHVWSKLAGGAAWSIEPFAPGAASYKVYRLDLRTGQVSMWYETKTAIQPLSPTPDGGLLVYYGAVGSIHLAVLTAPNVYVPLTVPSDFKLNGGRLTRPGVWLSLTDGIALYTKAEGIKIMALSAGYVPGGFGFYQAAGGCW